MGELIFGVIFDLVCGSIVAFVFGFVWAAIVGVFTAIKKVYVYAQVPRVPKWTNPNPRARGAPDPLAPKLPYEPTTSGRGARKQRPRSTRQRSVADRSGRRSDKRKR